MKDRIKLNIQEVISLYEKGMTQDEIAVRLGTTQKVIWSRLKRIGYKCRVAAKRDQKGEKNHMWKGKDAGYASLHRRVEMLRGKPKECEECGTTTARMYNWANLTGDYANIYDYKRLCRSCHAKLDNHARFLPHGKVVQCA